MSSVFVIITSLKCGHCRKFRGNGTLDEGISGNTISIYGNNGKGWRWDKNFFLSILLADESIRIYDIVFMDIAPKRYYSINKYTLRSSPSSTTTYQLVNEEINERNVVGNVPPASVLENYIEKYPCFLFVNGNLWNLFSSIDSWKEYEHLFDNEETISKNYQGSPMYAVAPITNSTPTVLKGYGPKGIFSFEYLQKYKDDLKKTRFVDIVDEFRKFSCLSEEERSFPTEESQRSLDLRVPSYDSLAVSEWTQNKPFFIDRKIPFDVQTFMYTPYEYRCR